MKIVIKKTLSAEKLLWFILLVSILANGLGDLFPVTRIISYLIDIALLILIIICRKNLLCIRRNRKCVFVFIVLFAVFTLVSYVVSYQSIFYYLWGFRNTFRFYLFFLLCVVTLKEQDIAFAYKLFEQLFWINFVCCIVMYFVFNIRQDMLGGIFGVSSGCNGYLNIFLVIVIGKKVLDYLNHKIRLSVCALYILASVFIAALSELKFFFAELFFIIAIMVVIIRFDWRSFVIVLLVCAAAYGGVVLLVHYFPEWAGTFSIKQFISIGTAGQGYTGIGDLNRLTAIQTIDKKYFKDLWDQFCGLGLGNCDYSSYEFLTTPFYQANGWIHYTWFSSAFVYLEMGWIGLLFYFGFFIMIAVIDIRRLKTHPACKFELLFSLLMALCCIPISIYDVSLRTEAGYMMYFIMSLSFIQERRCKL